jgi:hypothetical protein
MFYFIDIAVAILLEQEYEQQAFQKALAALPEDQRWEFEKAYLEKQEKRRQEAEIERRHQELCEAIRDSRPRGVGIFL